MCEATGDGLRDTPADPELNDNFSCTFNSAGNYTSRTDNWGDHYALPPTGSTIPDTRNIMSYNGVRGCRDIFSRLQIAVMLNSIYFGKSNSNYSAWKDAKGEYDEYEMDNFSQVARPIVLNEVQERNFHQEYVGDGIWGQCDVDWVRFAPVCSGSFTIETSAMPGRTNANTRLTLFDNALNQLAQNDDISGSNLYSNINFNFTAGNTYFIRVENMSNGTTGYYQLKVLYAPQITGLDNFCGQTTYSIPTVPLGAVVSWSASPGGIVTPATYTGNPVTVTGISNGDFTLTAQINACGQNYTLTKAVHVGAPPTPGPINWSWDTPPGRVLLSVGIVPTATSYKWYLDGTLKATTTNPTYQLPMSNVSCGNTYVFAVEAINSCGTSQQSYTSAEMPPCEGFAYMVAPNPGSDNINVEANTGTLAKSNATQASEIQQIELLDKTGVVRQKQKFAKGTLTATVPVSSLPNDVYTLRIFDGQVWHSVKIIVQH